MKFLFFAFLFAAAIGDAFADECSGNYRIGESVYVYGADYPNISRCYLRRVERKDVYQDVCNDAYPEFLPAGAVGEHSRVSSLRCWEIKCEKKDNYFPGRIAADGTRDSITIRYDQCGACPAKEEVSMDFTDPSKIVIMVKTK
ncbi:MAG: hypothetical protein LBL46_04870 [Rickettsiales bacterium]|nr:hypothetical protein [Rickettsiales bacterium]